VVGEQRLIWPAIAFGEAFAVCPRELHVSLQRGREGGEVIVGARQPPALLSCDIRPGAFGGELCRLRLEALARYRAEALGSFFEPARTGTVYALTPDREAGAARAPERAEWRYDGPSLAPRLGRVGRVRVLRERARGAGASWTADRGLVLTGADGTECLLLAVSEPEAALFLPTPGLHRALLEPGRALQPGVTVRDLLGHGERDGDLDVTAELHPL